MEAQMVNLLEGLDGAGKRLRDSRRRVEREVEVYHNAVQIEQEPSGLSFPHGGNRFRGVR